MPPPPDARNRADLPGGRIVGTFGLHGELKLDASRLGADALRSGLAVTLRYDDGRERAAVVAAVRMHKGRPLLRLAGIDDATAAEALGRPEIRLAPTDVSLDEGEYLDADLIGCRLVDTAGADRGTVVDVAHYPAQDMLLIGPERALLPLVRAFVLAVDLPTRTIRVDVPPGLLDPAEADEA